MRNLDCVKPQGIFLVLHHPKTGKSMNSDGVTNSRNIYYEEISLSLPTPAIPPPFFFYFTGKPYIDKSMRVFLALFQAN